MSSWVAAWVLRVFSVLIFNDQINQQRFVQICINWGLGMGRCTLTSSPMLRLLFLGTGSPAPVGELQFGPILLAVGSSLGLSMMDNLPSVLDSSALGIVILDKIVHDLSEDPVLWFLEHVFAASSSIQR